MKRKERILKNKVLTLTGGYERHSAANGMRAIQSVLMVKKDKKHIAAINIMRPHKKTLRLYAGECPGGISVYENTSQTGFSFYLPPGNARQKLFNQGVDAFIAYIEGMAKAVGKAKAAGAQHGQPTGGPA